MCGRNRDTISELPPDAAVEHPTVVCILCTWYGIGQYNLQFKHLADILNPERLTISIHSNKHGLSIGKSRDYITVHH